MLVYIEPTLSVLNIMTRTTPVKHFGKEDTNCDWTRDGRNIKSASAVWLYFDENMSLADCSKDPSPDTFGKSPSQFAVLISSL